MNHIFAIVVMIKEFMFWYMSKDDAINITKNIALKKVVYHKFFLLYTKIVKQLIIKETEKQY